MGERTAIAWTDRTFNAWLGCLKISPGCHHCYAERFTQDRMGLDVWGPASTTDRKRTAGSTWTNPKKWDREAARLGRPLRVFCGSLMDWAEDHPQLDQYRADLWRLIRQTPNLHWQLLTKRADRIRHLLPIDWAEHEHGYPNVWLGVSIESQEYAHRADALRKIPASVHFISYEPALGPLDLNLRGIEWLICGGESGPGFRQMDMAWARSMRDQCVKAGTAFFMKQGAAPRTEMFTYLEEADGSRWKWKQYPNDMAPPERLADAT